jgi:hypothetical protein
MEAKSSCSGSARGGIHEHGEWEVVGGGEAKVFAPT